MDPRANAKWLNRALISNMAYFNINISLFSHTNFHKIIFL